MIDPGGTPLWISRLREVTGATTDYRIGLGARSIGDPWDRSEPLDEDFPEPEVGMCAAGHIALAVWRLPRDGKTYCSEHLRHILRIATWPDPLHSV